MLRHLALKPFIVFSALILTMAWSSTAMPASDATQEKKRKATSEAPKKPDEPRKKADDSSKKPDQAAKKHDESDPHQTCLAKIPDEATLGQRMLAEQSCNREEERRKQTGSAAKF